MTSTIARHDVHTAAHANFDPADYRFIGVLDTDTSLSRSNDFVARRKVKALEAEGFPYVLVHPHGQCDSCGQHLRYVAVMFHHPSAALVEVGVNCLTGRFSMAQAEIKRMMAEAKKAREAHALLDAFLAQCAENQELAYATYAKNLAAAAPEGTSTWGTDTLASIATSARQYGSATDSQLALIGRILDELESKFAEQAARNAARAAERNTRVDAFIGTVDEKKRPFTGVVRLVKVIDTMYGTSTLHIIDTAEGTVKWFTSAAVELNAGDEVTFTATVKAHEIYDGERQTAILRPKFA
jgi:plastocyanin